MHNNCLRYFFLAGIAAISQTALSQPPFMIAKEISQNKIVGFNKQKLLIIDFWATWCGACPTAAKQLEILQQSMPDDVFIVSVSDETEKTISDYLQRNPIRLAVMQDYLPFSMINLFKVKSRPYSVLLDMDGKILYKGHPANITRSMIEKYALQSNLKPAKNWSDLFYTVPAAAPNNDFTPANRAELQITREASTDRNMNFDNGVFYYSGTLSGLIKYLMDCSDFQLSLKGITDYGVSMSCSESDLSHSKSDVLQKIESRLSLKIQTGSKRTEAYMLKVANPDRLWNNKQINWGSDSNPTYMVGTERIEADNLTIKGIANLLSDVKGKLYYYNGTDNSPHDWRFNYQDDKLMTENLETAFGIQISKETTDIPVYIVSQK